jgi:hypothetical protein
MCVCVSCGMLLMQGPIHKLNKTLKGIFAESKEPQKKKKKVIEAWWDRPQTCCACARASAYFCMLIASTESCRLDALCFITLLLTHYFTSNLLGQLLPLR